MYLHAVDTVNYSPTAQMARYMYIWTPFNWWGNDGTKWYEQSVQDAAIKVKDYNYDWVQAADHTENNDDVENCTLANFKLMAVNGIALILSHGINDYIAEDGTMVVAGIWIAHFATLDEAALYANGEPGLIVSDCENGGYAVKATAEWFSTNWKPVRDAIHGITIAWCCHVADSEALFSSLGGQTTFAWTCVVSTQPGSDVPLLLDRMTGRAPLFGQGRRAAHDAWDAGGLSAELRMRGGYSTLCPAPYGTYPAGNGTGDVAGYIRGDGARGCGVEVFDSYIDSEAPPNTAIEVLVAENGSIGDRRWFGNAGRMYWGVSFDYVTSKAPAVPAFTLKADGAWCTTDILWGQFLDGNGIIPNKDPHTWSWSPRP